MTHSKQRREVAMVTGANGAIGQAICEGIAERDAYEVVLLCRDRNKAERACGEVVERTGNDHVRYEIADVSRPGAIERLADGWTGPLDVLVNNAAVTPRGRTETEDGLELQFATNVMGYFWMIRAFEDILAESAPSRVVNVASYWAGGLELDDLQFERRRYDNDGAYRQSKQADRMLSAAFAERLSDRGISVNSCHPGDVPSKLAKNLGFGGSDSPAQAADTPVWLATSDAGLDHSGGYFSNRSQQTCRYSSDTSAVDALYERCLEIDRQVRG